MSKQVNIFLLRKSVNDMAANKAFVSDHCSFIPFQNCHKNSKESVHTYNSRRVVKKVPDYH